ncbi:hypothetical protein TIFTF001_021871 [Ficus carica]|uniref:Uncharacterized protein n=1 Tax=Ficus carica TaxID=3494 RepID=A0AA88AT21_FICCA|nr:hypothetical protein TIFTF001_021871 [Ficus carica]
MAEGEKRAHKWIERKAEGGGSVDFLRIASVSYSIVMEKEIDGTDTISVAIWWSQISIAILSPSFSLLFYFLNFFAGRLPIVVDSFGRIFGREEQVLFGLTTSLVSDTGAVVFSGSGVMVI